MGARTTGKTRVRRRAGWADQQSVFWYRLVHFLIGLGLRLWVRYYHAFGVENVPATGGAFLIANHTSASDPLLIGYAAVQRMLSGPGKVELFTNPILGYIMRKIGMFPLRQDAADAAAVRTMIELYRRGRVVIVFPEGGRSASGEMRPFVPEFARLVIRLKAPIVPAAIAGARELLPIGARIPRHGAPVVVVFGQQFDMQAFYGQPLTPENVERAAQFLQDRVAELLVCAHQERSRLKSELFKVRD